MRPIIRNSLLIVSAAFLVAAAYDSIFFIPEGQTETVTEGWKEERIVRVVGSGWHIKWPFIQEAGYPYYIQLPSDYQD